MIRKRNPYIIFISATIIILLLAESYYLAKSQYSKNNKTQPNLNFTDFEPPSPIPNPPTNATFEPAHLDDDVIVKEQKLEAKCENVDLKEHFINIIPSFEDKPPKKRAVMMLLSSENNVDVDFYYIATLITVFRLLKHPSYKISDEVDVTVLVTNTVSQEKINELLYLGARVYYVKPINLNDPKFNSGQWKNCFTKLLIFLMYFYEYVAYIDSDVLITRSLTEKEDSIFKCLDDAKKNNPLLKYVFGATRDVGLGENTFNGGVMLFQPDCDIYKQLMKIIPKTELYDVGFMEQGLLNYAFNVHAPLFYGTKWTRMPYKYNAHWLKNDAAISNEGHAVVHDKFWREIEGWRNPKIQQKWWDAMEELQLWHLSVRGYTSINVKKKQLI